ncbi:MAG TPA: phosphoribosyl-AMP cyclohydrolase [Fibrobacteria bacterium]|nr:phosphoribosyl-AMP cyclohydrolase [Fibrobacteria bacterium]
MSANDAIEPLLGQVRFGADGLVTAVAVDEGDGQVLMLAHMNRESLGLTLATGYMTYWSRSRKKLWLKGETSGNRQRVVSASLDCDGDALLFRVKPEGNGAACHEGYRSCFFRLRKDGEWEIQGKPVGRSSG